MGERQPEPLPQRRADGDRQRVREAVPHPHAVPDDGADACGVQRGVRRLLRRVHRVDHEQLGWFGTGGSQGGEPPNTLDTNSNRGYNTHMTAAIAMARDIRTVLSTGAVCSVTFRKVDGEVTPPRKITRNQQFIPVEKRPKYVKAEDPHYIVAFDIIKGGWIRFHESNTIGWDIVRA